MKGLKRILVVGAVLVLGLEGLANGDPTSKTKVLICYTTGSVAVREARQATEKMVRVLERLGGFKEGEFSALFTDDEGECGRLLETERPSFAIPSLAFYLEKRGSFGLLPIARPKVQGQTTERYRLVVKKGRAKSLDDLRGATLAGTVLESEEFLTKVVFGKKVEAGKFFKLQKTKQALRALRDLAGGKIDAVLLNEQQFRATEALPFASDLVVVFESDPIPLPPVLSVGAVKGQERFSSALTRFCDDKDGRSYCDLFGLEAFVKADESAYKGVIQAWEGK